MTAPEIVSIIGHSNSGKTTLVERLIPVLRKEGLRVGILKHHGKDFEFDVPGKDTWRHARAGADVVVLSTPFGTGVTVRVEREPALDTLIERYFSGMDLVITEGYKRGPYPKIEVVRAANNKPPIPDREATWIAFVRDRHLVTSLPVFPLDDIAAIAAFLRQQRTETGSAGRLP